MELWFTEKHTEGLDFRIKIKEHLYTNQSKFQKIDVLDSFEFGRILLLDGMVMITEKDEFIYHEMITHVPMAVNPYAEKILVIGAGDGGVASQLIKYAAIKQIDIVEIDEEVINTAKKYFTSLADSFNDKRVRLIFEDGLKYIRKVRNEYDLIIVDSTDPYGPGEGLFAKEFYGSCYSALKEDGIMVNQHESPFYDEYKNIVKNTHNKIKTYFPVCTLYQAHIPTYPSGHWLFGFASKLRNEDTHPDWKSLNIDCRYYNTELHKGSFALPTYAKELIK